METGLEKPCEVVIEFIVAGFLFNQGCAVTPFLLALDKQAGSSQVKDFQGFGRI